jgi:hypothetical protein
MRIRRFLLLAALALLPLPACNGGGNGGPTSPAPPGTSTNPCTNALTAEDIPPARVDEQLRTDKREAIDRDTRYRVFDALSFHREAAQWRERAARERLAQGPVSSPDRAGGRANVDIGEIAVVQDEGDLIAPPNSYDLRGLGLRYTRNGAGGYDVRRITAGFRTSLGRQLSLSDDDSASANVAFSFNFFGRGQTVAFVNSDGNVTFEEEDRASTERNVARLLTGPPRVAPFLADLDPSAGGRVFVNAAADQYTVTWCNVRGFESTRTITTQVTLLPDGAIEMQYMEASVSLSDAVVGVSPGRTGAFRSVNLSDQGPTDGGSGAVGERFAARPQLDNVALARKFYATHADNYDQLVIWTDVSLVQNSFAFEQTVANEVGGIGVAQFDASREFGSGGRLRSLVMMDWVGKYPDDPQQRFLGENNTVSLLGQETGHRWLAFFDFRDPGGARSDLLLGRDQAHWSFFFDSDASVMEGNDIEDLGGGSFRTAAAVRRFSLLDQYAMGLVRDVDVPPFFYVDNPTNLSVTRTRESAPQVGVTFNGTRREVLIQDVIAIHGQRTPSANNSPRVLRQAFLYLSSAGRNPDSAQVSKLDRIRLAWEQFFLQATDGRMTTVTSLR